MFPKQHRFWRVIATLLTALIAAVFGSNSTQALSEQTQASLDQTIDDRIARIREEFSDIEEATSIKSFMNQDVTAQIQPPWDNWNNSTSSPSPSPSPRRTPRRRG